MIRLRVLGPIELHDSQGRELRAVLAQPKRLALLVCLVVGPRGFRRRDSLLALLWPELDTARARAALNQAVRFLRKELGPSEVLVSRGLEEIGVSPDELWCDAQELQDHMEAGRYNEALQLYRGALLAGFHGAPDGGFEEWLARERELLRAAAARAARELAATHERDQHFTPAVASARRAVELAEGDERMVRQLLQLLDRIGDRAGALQAYGEFARRLERDFDVSPAPETQAVMERIRSRASRSALPEPEPNGEMAPQAGATVQIESGAQPENGVTSMPRARASWSGIAGWITVGAAMGSLLTWLLGRVAD